MPLDIDKEKFIYRVNIEFRKKYSDIKYDISNWNEACAIAMELCGLPGDKFMCRVTPEVMEFWFAEEKDAVFFELTCG